MQEASKKGFLNISIETCGKVYFDVQKNAEAHFICASVLADALQYPNAVAHLILGSEELIKALAIFLESKGFDLRRITNYKRLFSNHKARHSIVKEFYSVVLFFKQLVIKDQSKTKNHWLFEGLEFLKNVLNTGVLALNNYTWWHNAEMLKQNCFYVDYADGLILPSVIVQSDYDKALSLVESFREDVRLIILLLNKANNVELENFLAAFNMAELKTLLGETLERSNAKQTKL